LFARAKVVGTKNEVIHLLLDSKDFT
jgi:hypothetical protein